MVMTLPKGVNLSEYGGDPIAWCLNHIVILEKTVAELKCHDEETRSVAKKDHEPDHFHRNNLIL